MARTALKDRMKPASEQKIAYAKVMIFGPTGSGKTTVAAKIAQGLIEKYGLSKRVYGYDTERRLKAVEKKFFIPKNIEMYLVESRSLQDARDFMQMCEEEQKVGMMDNTTHIWQYCMENYLFQKNKANKARYGGKAREQKRLYLNDWQELKPEWNRKFDTPFVSTKAHLIQVCRDKNVFEEFEEEKGNKTTRSIQQTGTAPRIEGNSAFEPYLIIETFIEHNEKYGHVKGEPKYIFKAVVAKDNFGPLTGKEFTDPKFEDFLPAFDELDIGDKANEYDLSGHDENFSEMENADGTPIGNQRKRKIYLDSIDDILTRIFPGTGHKEKVKRTTILKALAGESAWSHWESLHLARLEFYHTAIKEIERLFGKYLDILDNVTPESRNESQKKVVSFFEFKNIGELETNVKKIADKLQKESSEALKPNGKTAELELTEQ